MGRWYLSQQVVVAVIFRDVPIMVLGCHALASLPAALAFSHPLLPLLPRPPVVPLSSTNQFLARRTRSFSHHGLCSHAG